MLQLYRTSAMVVGVAALLGTHAAAQPVRKVPSADRIRHVADSLLDGLHARGEFNGAVVLGRGNEEVYARGFGPANLAAGFPFTPDTPADGASIAKTFTAAAVFLLEDAGRLRLDDPVTKYVPEYPHEQTRIRDLLSHSTGLPETDYDFFEGIVSADSVKTTLQFLALLRARGVRPEFPPGSRFRYSNLGWDVAALVVERVTGQRWDEFLRERVFAPLGMQNTFLRPARLADWPGVRTLSYRRVGDTLALYDVFDNEGFYGASNLYFSARDLHRWSRSFYTRPVLSRPAMARGEAAAMLTDPEAAIKGRSALSLLSWYYHPKRRRFHYPGSLQGFWGSVYRDEDQRYSVVYLSNNGMPQWLRPLLTRALIDVLEGRTPKPLRAPASYTQVRGPDVARAAGKYRVPGVGVATLTARAEQLFLQVNEGVEYPMVQVGDGLRYVPGMDAWIGFSGPATSHVSSTRSGSEPLSRLHWLSIFAVSEGQRLR